MSTDYTKFDAAVIDKIGAEPKQFALIFVGDVRDECERIARALGTARSPFGVDPFRILDRRLQALRKRGVIRSTTKGWVRDTAA